LKSKKPKVEVKCQELVKF